MDTERIHDARLLFVIALSYGEMGSAMHILNGQLFQHPPTILLPPTVYTNNKFGLPGKVHKYTSIRDVIKQVETGRPDIVFLNSGYLFAIKKTFSLDQLTELTRFLNKRGCRVVTTDPFLGLIPHLTPEDLSDHMPAREWFFYSVTHACRHFQTTLHYYPYPLEASDFQPAYPCVSCRNRKLELTPAQLETNSLRVRGRSRAEVKPQWLFVLAGSDFYVQCIQHSPQGFGDLLVTKIRETLRADRHAVVLAPDGCIEYLSEQLQQEAGITLLPHCSYSLFFALQMEAEYAFYWNIFSNSLMLRGINGLPTFFFDKGHMNYGISSLYEVGLVRYYRGWEPRYLRIGEEILPDQLALYAEEYRQAIKQLLLPIQDLPSPHQMLDQILEYDLITS